MRFNVPGSKDFYTGLLFVAFGALAIVVASDYPMGTTMRMGPGYFPTVVGAMLALLGLGLAVRALFAGAEPVGVWVPRPLLVVQAAVVAFAVLVERLGLVVAAVALVVLAAVAGGEARLQEVVLLSLALVVLAVGVFAYGLGLPFTVWPG